MPIPPYEFLLKKWREKYDIGWLEGMATPQQAVYNDLEMDTIEADHAAMREELRKSQQPDVR